ncbi:hypothetical protein HPB47_018683 [Ixodes persulcatus]|uniref:Uncharacterized protein n=1 Tax=Ixodes persulcatus TaxID=34615 RepID=A0AC60QMN2_IXOPE|nr:hypothetical protein HPB47_018683 [Ixodes persulcatus]
MHFYDVDVKVTWKAWGDNIVNQDIRQSIAVKNLAIALWGSSVLLQRTVTEVASNASLNKDSGLPLTPKKVAFLRGPKEGPSQTTSPKEQERTPSSSACLSGRGRALPTPASTSSRKPGQPDEAYSPASQQC